MAKKPTKLLETRTAKMIRLEATLKKLKAMPIANDDDYMAALQLFGTIKDDLEPTDALMVGMELGLRLYNARKKPEDQELTITDALILAREAGSKS